MGHQKVRLPTCLGSGKVQPHSIRQIRETAAGGEENREGSGLMRGKGQISWKEEPSKE